MGFYPAINQCIIDDPVKCEYWQCADPAREEKLKSVTPCSGNDVQEYELAF